MLCHDPQEHLTLGTKAGSSLEGGPIAAMQEQYERNSPCPKILGGPKEEIRC